MILLQSDELHEHAEGIIHEETQQHQYSLDLTVDSILSFQQGGALDFGGSEFKPAVTKVLDPKKRQPEDDYGWWELDRGTYRLRFNEALKNSSGTFALISAHTHASQVGLQIQTNTFTEENVSQTLAVNITVPSVGCSIKENARLATLHIFAN